VYVVLGELGGVVPLTTLCCPMNNLIGLILLACIPGKVVEPIVRRIVVREVTALHPRRTRADEGFKHQAMDEPFV
jgi:hypothetical protein